MKKLMLAAAALAACAAMADGEIASANVVGYNTITIRPGWNMFSVSFKDPSNENGIALQDLFPGEAMAAKGAKAGGGATTADSIQVYDAVQSKYSDTYILYYTSKGSNTSRNYKWLKGSTVSDEVRFTNGQAFWYKSLATEPFTTTVSGEVDLSSSKTVTILPGWNMIGHPYAGNFNPNALGTEYWKAKIDAGEAKAGGGATTADSIQIYDASAGKYSDTYVLYYTSKGTNTTRNYKWIKGSTVPDGSAEFLSVGKGTWYKCLGDGFTLTIPRPYSL